MATFSQIPGDLDLAIVRGDLVAAVFASVGITKDRAQAVAELAGFEGCGCKQRQAKLNELGYRLGIGQAPSGPVDQ